LHPVLLLKDAVDIPLENAVTGLESAARCRPQTTTVIAAARLSVT
jgi:hypothetical protein